MWLRRLVGFVVIVTFISMNVLAIAGLFSKPKNANEIAGLSLAPPSVEAAPTISFSVDPATIPAGTTSALQWETTGNPACTASGDWKGDKTAFGAESTGRVSTEGKRVYTLTCTNAGGSAQANVELSVGPANSAPVPATQTKAATKPTTPTYCGGRSPCYGPKDVAAHSSAGNCWGWNGDRVMNISNLDANFHQAKSGISSIQVSDVCGHDLAASLSGSVSAGGQTRNHNNSTKSNSDRNEIPYFVGYFDANK